MRWKQILEAFCAAIMAWLNSSKTIEEAARQKIVEDSKKKQEAYAKTRDAWRAGHATDKLRNGKF